MAEMSTRERFQAVMNFQPFDRLPIVEWAGWWDKTIERWHGEGLDSQLSDRYDICRHFGLEVYLQDWFPVRGPECPAPPHHGAGIIASEEDYERILPHLYPRNVVNRELWTKWAEIQSRGENVLWITLEGFFWFPRTLLGIEPHFYAFYDQPALLHRINSDLAEFHLRVLDELFELCVPDFVTFAEDMSYNHGPMLSKGLFEEFMPPYYHRVLPKLKKHGALAIIDSDGDITEPLPWFAAAGLQGILPLERQAGVDVNKLRENYPDMRFVGCFDKMSMFRGEAAMRAEFERLLPAAAAGGLIVSCDHQTPPEVSYDQYELYLSLFREYAVEAAHYRNRLPTSGSGSRKT